MFNNSTKSTAYLPIILCVFAITLMLLGKYHHELWIDEWHAISFSSSANSLKELRHFARCEGHPMGYFLILYAIKSIANSQLFIWLVHALFGCIMFYFLFIKSPFSIYIKLAFLASFYFIWELPVMYRVYVIIMAVLFYLVNGIAQKNIKLWLSILLTTILMHLHMYALLIALPLLAYHIFTIKSKFGVFVLGSIMLFFALQLILVYYSILPHPDCIVKVQMPPLTFSTIIRLANNINSGFLIRPFAQPILALVVAIILLVTSLFAIANNTLRFFYIATILGLLAVGYLIGAVYIRHLAYYFYAFLVYYWLYLSHSPKIVNYNKSAIFIFIILFGFQIKSGLQAYYFDITKPFSNSKNVAAFLNSNVTNNTPIYGNSVYVLESVPPYLNRPIFGIQNEQLYNFCILTKNEFDESLFTNQKCVDYINKINTKHKRWVLVVSQTQEDWLYTYLQKNENAKLLAKFVTPNFSVENFYVFEMKGSKEF